MSYLLLSSFLLLARLEMSSALPQAGQTPDFTQWSPAGPNDVRSPCPGLNSLANHNILPHSGKDITYPMLQQAVSSALNVGSDLATTFFTGATVLGLTSKDQNSNLAFDLDTISKHGAIEHDGSLSRADFNLGGDDHSFNQTIFDTVMAYYAGMTETTLQAAGQARMNRILTEKARDPAFAYNPANQIVSNAETSLYLGVLGDINTGIAPVNYVQIFFEQERLPYTEGWRPSSTPIGLLNLNVLIAKVASASGETAVDLETMTATTLKNALSNIF